MLLRPPRTAATKGAVLQLKFAIPDVSLAKLKAMSLSAYVNGTALRSGDLHTSGAVHLSAATSPPTCWRDDVVRIDFSLDKTMPPSAADRRELGVVASMVGLQPK